MNDIQFNILAAGFIRKKKTILALKEEYNHIDRLTFSIMWEYNNGSLILGQQMSNAMEYNWSSINMDWTKIKVLMNK